MPIHPTFYIIPNVKVPKAVTKKILSEFTRILNEKLNSAKKILTFTKRELFES